MHTFVLDIRRKKYTGCLAAVLLLLFFQQVRADHSNEFLLNKWTQAPAEFRALIGDQAPVDDVINFTDNTIMLLQSLPFYKGVYIAAVQGDWSPKDLTLFYLITEKGEIERINGRPEVFGKLAKTGRFNFDSSYMAHYLWFRMFFTRNEQYSPFLILESPDATYFPDLDSIEGSMARKIRNTVRPISCQKSSVSLYSCSAVILYEKAIYEVRIDVDENGGVDMREDNVLLTNIPYHPRIPLGIWAIEGQFQPSVTDKPQKPNEKSQSTTSKKNGWSF